MIRFSHVTKRYGRMTAVSDLSFDTGSGGVCGLLGRNGAGKTTSINLALGLVFADRGEIEILGHPIPSKLNQALVHIGPALEKPAFYPFLTGRENLRLLAKLRGPGSVCDADKALEMVGLTSRGRDRYGTYSRGMKRRLGLAAALMPDAQLLILDEPQEGLDPAGIAELRTLLVHQAEALGKTIFISSHRLSEMERICHRVVIIDQGSLVIQGQLADLLGPGPELIRLETRQVDPTREMLIQQGCWIAPWGTGETDLWFSRPACAAPLALHAAPGIGEQLHPRSLETLFLALTGSSISL